MITVVVNTPWLACALALVALALLGVLGAVVVREFSNAREWDEYHTAWCVYAHDGRHDDTWYVPTVYSLPSEGWTVPGE